MSVADHLLERFGEFPVASFGEKTHGSHHGTTFQKIAKMARHAKFDDFSINFDQILHQKDMKTIKTRTFSNGSAEPGVGLRVFG
jgi:hypothetical protein